MIYLKLEQVKQDYYVVFDHRSKPQTIESEDLIEDRTIVSYVIPVIQEMPSKTKPDRFLKPVRFDT